MADECEREVKEMQPIILEDNKVEPWLLVYQHKEKISIIINKKKLQRVLDQKNTIQYGIDIFLVDKIKEVLKNLASIEESMEKESEEKNGKGVQEHKGIKDFN